MFIHKFIHVYPSCSMMFIHVCPCLSMFIHYASQCITIYPWLSVISVKGVAELMCPASPGRWPMPKSSLCQIRLRGVDASEVSAVKVVRNGQKWSEHQSVVMLRPWKITRIYPYEFDEKQQAEGWNMLGTIWDLFAFNVFLAERTLASTSDIGHWELNVKKLNESRRMHHLCMAESVMCKYIYIYI